LERVLSEVSQVIHEQLEGQEAKPIPNGYRWEISEGHTDLIITPVSIENNEWGLCEVISIKTSFKEGTYKLNEGQIAFLNRRSVFGNFYLHDGRLECKQTISIYENEPASRWYALIILTGLGSQLPFAIGQLQSEASDEHLRGNRANLEYPRFWEIPPSSEPFDQSAERFQELGFVATRGPHGLVLEVPMSTNTAPTRLVDQSAETALLHVSVDTPHPLGGVGYLSTIAVPLDPAYSEIVEVSAKLNELEHKQLDFVPRLGAWGVRGMGNQLVYSMFWPTAESDDTMHQTMMNWMLQRTIWLRDNYWTPEVGIELEGLCQ
jgi:hypothetical protein